MKKKLIVMSADAMVFEDVEYLKKCDNYKKYFSNGCWIKKIDSIYPTVTYPCHTTMATGAWPDKHGLTSNFDARKIGVEPMPWTWFHDLVKTDDIFSAAKRAGLSTAAVFWPVTGGHPDIDYLIAEYWTQGHGDTLRDAFGRCGSGEDMLNIIERHQEKLVERKHPMCDEFLVACACDIIREKKPDLLMLHPANIDACRHKYGLFNDKVLEGIGETDRWIGKIMEAVHDAGMEDEVNLVLTSDHGQVEIQRIVNLNVLFADRNLIEVDDEGRIVDWKAYCLSNGLSALVYLKDESCRDQVAELLYNWKEEGIYGFSEVYTEQEARQRYHLGGGFSFVLESDGITSIGTSCAGPLVSRFGMEDYRYGRATHGHLPFKGPQPTFLAMGPDFKEGVVLEHGRLIDQAPTYAKLLGCELKHADGVALDEILKA